MNEPKPASKIWLETSQGYVFGPGVYKLLKAIKETGTLKEASNSLGMSYRYSWGLIKKAEETLGAPLVEASKGGRLGGGSSKITKLGEHFINDFEQIQNAWLDFREQYENSTLVDGRVILVDGDLAIQIDEPIFLDQDLDTEPGKEITLRILLV
jgi:molybdate transport repressor ModE-like protein